MQASSRRGGVSWAGRARRANQKPRRGGPKPAKGAEAGCLHAWPLRVEDDIIPKVLANQRPAAGLETTLANHEQDGQSDNALGSPSAHVPRSTLEVAREWFTRAVRSGRLLLLLLITFERHPAFPPPFFPPVSHVQLVHENVQSTPVKGAA